LSSTSPLGAFSRSVIAVGEHGGAHRVALRAGISVAVPLITIWALGHVEWSLYAAFGAFTALYGRSSAPLHRLKMQLSAAVVLIASLLLGVVVATLPDPEWAVVVVATVWTMLVAAVSDALNWHPPGPLFAVFALCAVASVPVQATSFRDALLVSAVSALFSILVGLLGHSRSTRRSTALRTGPARPTIRQRFSGREEWFLLLRFGVAAGTAGTLSTALGIGHPYWAMVAAIVPISAVNMSHSLVRATHRVVGTFLGLVLAWAILLFEPSGLIGILLVVALQVAAELLIGRNYALALIFVTPLALVMIALAHPVASNALIVDRAVETALGTVVALGVVLLSWLTAQRARA
jgi:uncharacterized membrane protein YccC